MWDAECNTCSGRHKSPSEKVNVKEMYENLIKNRNAVKNIKQISTLGTVCTLCKTFALEEN